MSCSLWAQGRALTTCQQPTAASPGFTRLLPSICAAPGRRAGVQAPAVVRASYQGLGAPEQAALLGGGGFGASAADDTSAATGAGDLDTIAAIVTGATQGAVAIVRLSGEDATHIARSVFRPGPPPASPQAPAKASSPAAEENTPLWEPETHRVYYGHAVDALGSAVDEVLVLVMLGPRSYTAEDVVEVHSHGGPVCAGRVLSACLAAGARLARPGEFTLRAFLNGRLDLAQAESVSQLLEARTVAAADSALAGLSGGIGGEVAGMREECFSLLVEMDARLDFEEDLPPLDVPATVARIRALESRLAAALATSRQGALLQRGLQVALVGRPNVGKSSLLNAVSGTERAIVTEIEGTTRDIVEAGVVIGGVPVTLLDTAGLRESEDRVERIGVQRSMAAAQQADMVLMVVDAAAGWTPGDQAILDGMRGLAPSTPPQQHEQQQQHHHHDHHHQGHGHGGSNGSSSTSSSQFPPSILVLNKADLGGAEGQALPLPDAVRSTFQSVVETSATTGEGLPALRQAVLTLAGAPELAPGGVSWAVNGRQAEALTRATEALGRVVESVEGQLPVDFWTIDLRAALLALGEVTGDDVTEEVLDQTFSRFCLGK